MITAIKAVAVSNTQLSISIGTDFESDYFPELSPEFTDGRPEQELCTLKVECWTEECASYIRYNKEAK